MDDKEEEVLRRRIAELKLKNAKLELAEAELELVTKLSAALLAPKKGESLSDVEVLALTAIALMFIAYLVWLALPSK